MKLFAHKTINISSNDENPFTEPDSGFYQHKVNTVKGKITYISDKKDSFWVRASYALLNTIKSLAVILAVVPIVKDPQCLKRLWKRVRTGKETQIVFVDQNVKNLFQKTLMRVNEPFDLDFKYIFLHREMIFNDESNVSYFLDLITNSYSRYRIQLFNHLSQKTDDENIDALLNILNDFDQRNVKFNISSKENYLGNCLKLDEVNSVLHVIKTTNKTVQKFLDIKFSHLPHELLENERSEDLMTLINYNQDTKCKLAKDLLVTGGVNYKSKRSQSINDFLCKNPISLSFNQIISSLSLEEFTSFQAALSLTIQYVDHQQTLKNYVDALKEKAGLEENEINEIELLEKGLHAYLEPKLLESLKYLISFSKILHQLTPEELSQISLKNKVDSIKRLLYSCELTTFEQYSEFWNEFKETLLN